MKDIADRLRAAGSTNPSGTHPYESLIDDAESAIRTLRAEGGIARKFVERIAKQPTVAELPEEAEGGDPESAYDIIVYEARTALKEMDTASGGQKS